MRALAVLALAGFLGGCSLVLRLDVTRAESTAGRAPAGESATTAGAPSLGSLLVAYRDELERYCADGALAGNHCAEHRQHLLDLFRATAEQEQERAARHLEQTADSCPNPTVRARLRQLARSILGAVLR